MEYMEYPRLGLIRIESFDRFLIDVFERWADDEGIAPPQA
jgi:hypothetical protein